MAAKGDRERLEPVARMMFCDGRSLTYIEDALGVSRQTLTEWKEWGGWEKAKAAKDNYEAQLLLARDTIMERISEAPLQAAAHIDTLSKIDAILDRRAKAAREATEAIAKQKGEMFLAVVRDLIEFGRQHDQGLVEAIEQNFDELVDYGRRKYAGA